MTSGVNHLLDRRAGRFALVVAVGFGFGLSNVALHALLARLHTTPANTLLDDVLVGLLATLLAHAWVSFTSERAAREHERLVLVAELNHHVRNALQVIQLAATKEELQGRVKLVQQGIDHIEYVLRDLVPTAADAPAPRLLKSDS